MNKQYATHWFIGIICAIIWFWGDYLKIPAAAVQLCASIVPGLLGHALAYSPPAAVPVGVLAAALDIPAQPEVKV